MPARTNLNRQWVFMYGLLSFFTVFTFESRDHFLDAFELANRLPATTIIFFDRSHHLLCFRFHLVVKESPSGPRRVQSSGLSHNAQRVGSPQPEAERESGYWLHATHS
jgi:hypothetical protein